MIGRAAVIALVAFMTLPTVVVIVVSVNPTAILSFPPTGFSLRWYANALTYPQFQRAAVNSVLVTAAASLLALPIGTAAALALERGRLRGRHVWATLLLSPLVVPARRPIDKIPTRTSSYGAPAAGPPAWYHGPVFT